MAIYARSRITDLPSVARDRNQMQPANGMGDASHLPTRRFLIYSFSRSAMRRLCQNCARILAGAHLNVVLKKVRREKSSLRMCMLAVGE
ncbi:hypothetical protein I7I50_09605 [Histoplasma capsulatum G186AR]|uniref:Uncharacterized protein n=1 Tax=Ajellomyces capsulatus TaxID=5037 RepID=A0A8H8D0H9_AJECA|nr:hypothetical protein I7I52_07135 [Histoplasma capsulatum]QSS74430.1 hypothetical protein I7I50_09605 [Histoplasma capsulatum G186AR]